MKVNLDARNIDKDVIFALIDHFSYSVSNINSYEELAEKEKYLIAKDTWNKMTYTTHNDNTNL